MKTQLCMHREMFWFGASNCLAAAGGYAFSHHAFFFKLLGYVH